MTERVDWQSIVFNPEWMKRLDHLAARRFGDGGLAETATTYVIEKLSENQWALLKRYQGRSKPETFLNTVAGNLVEEYSRRQFGRPRPPTWLQKQGELWTTIWRMICLERQMVPSVINTLAREAARQAEKVRSIIACIKAKIPRCGEAVREAANFQGDDESMEHQIPDERTPGSTMDGQVIVEMMAVIGLSIFSELPDQPGIQQAERTSKSWFSQWSHKLLKFQNVLELTDEERTVLKMHFQDELKFNAIAAALALPSHLPGRISKRALEKVRNALNQAGISMDELKQLWAKT